MADAPVTDPNTDGTRQRRRVLGWCLWIPAIGFAGFLTLAFTCLFASGFIAAQFEGPKVVSPDGQYEVQVFSDNCGATCAYHTSVVLRERNVPWRPWPFGNGPLGGDHSAGIHSSKNSPCGIFPKWDDSHHLTVGVAWRDSGAVYSRKSEWRDVTIEYVPLARDHRKQLDEANCDDRWEYPAMPIDHLRRIGSLALATFGGAGLIHIFLRRRRLLTW